MEEHRLDMDLTCYACDELVEDVIKNARLWASMEASDLKGALKRLDVGLAQHRTGS